MDPKLINLDHLDNYECWQLEKYGNILGRPEVMPNGEVIENGAEEMEREAEWVERQWEEQLHEKEY